MSAEASSFNLSEENNPPKLSCGLRCGRWRELGEIDVVKSSSQLSSPIQILLVGVGEAVNKQLTDCLRRPKSLSVNPRLC